MNLSLNRNGLKMNQDEFRKYIQDICTYYERRLPKDATCDLWFKKLISIPAEPLPWIFEKITENPDPPKNIPGLTWVFYKEWLTANPEKAEFKPDFDCPDCVDDRGYLHVHKGGYAYTYRCGMCKQGKIKIPFALKKDLIESGYEIEDPLKRLDRKLPRSIPKLVQNVFKVIK
jgi:hypothetical protein